ncbi:MULTISPECIES: type II toxin-antitoxin system PemK/MazF family toxin [unclassified Microbacterium]|uniref:type II toxin-antitoxin system PemK/MazF family toxin n=1 Tax=unclassified Microbacterium TaxID=2609290 RepID=UPI0027E244A7|nr:type II toxin-antitoxin system PemK/MazF family toxin [Microbacterium sp. zg.Y818]
MATRSPLRRLLSLFRRPKTAAPPVRPSDPQGRGGSTATVEITPPAAGALRLAYSPDRDGRPDGGEVVWTWVPYAERDGRGKDRPVLVIGRQSVDRVYALKLTSSHREGDGNLMPIGTGEWDSRRRPSWADLDQLYSVHDAGLRREGAALDRPAFTRVAAELSRRYGWRMPA